MEFLAIVANLVYQVLVVFRVIAGFLAFLDSLVYQGILDLE